MKSEFKNNGRQEGFLQTHFPSSQGSSSPWVYPHLEYENFLFLFLFCLFVFFLPVYFLVSLPHGEISFIWALVQFPIADIHSSLCSRSGICWSHLLLRFSFNPFCYRHKEESEAWVLIPLITVLCSTLDVMLQSSEPHLWDIQHVNSWFWFGSSISGLSRFFSHSLLLCQLPLSAAWALLHPLHTRMKQFESIFAWPLYFILYFNLI